MRCFHFLILGLVAFVTAASGDELVPGKRFPEVMLSPIAGDEAVSTRSLMGEKLMLHLFASW
ncbi:MAG: hypothetical protein QNL24_10200 [Akkermansiaceae bacterium]